MMSHRARLDPAPGRPLANGRIDFAAVNAAALAVLPVLPTLDRRWATLRWIG